MNRSAHRVRDFLLLVAALLALATTSAARALDQEPYVYDGNFNGGAAIEDRFAATSDQTPQDGQRIVLLGDGDVVAAGLVHEAYSSSTAPPSNVGLVRYGPNGERVPWSAPTSTYSYFNNMYVDYPNSSGGHFLAVRDIKELAGFIYVLADDDSSQIYDDIDVYILAFRGDGSFIDIYGAFTTTLPEQGAGLVAYSIPNCNGSLSCPMLIAVATYYTANDVLSQHVVTAKRFAMGNSGYPTFSPNGTLHVDTSFGPFGNGANDYHAPDSSCTELSGCWFSASAVAAVRTNTAYPVLYIGGTFYDTGELTDTAVAAVNGYDGALLSDFGNGGFEDVGVNAGQYNSYVDDQAVDIAATTSGARATDEIYVLSAADMDCAGGAAVIKLKGVQGVLDSAFGNGGFQLVGGNNDPFCVLPVYGTTPTGIALGSSSIAVVGSSTYYESAVQQTTDASLAILRRSDGNIGDFGLQPALHENGTPWLSYYPLDVTADSQDRFEVTGYLGDPGVAPLFGTTRFSSDRIFGNDFEVAP